MGSVSGVLAEVSDFVGPGLNCEDQADRDADPKASAERRNKGGDDGGGHGLSSVPASEWIRWSATSAPKRVNTQTSPSLVSCKRTSWRRSNAIME
jgi:hypothetical protein